LHVGSVEVVVGPAGERGEAKFIPEIWAMIRDMVDIKARVDIV
jgi:hypothetical protein